MISFFFYFFYFFSYHHIRLLRLQQAKLANFYHYIPNPNENDQTYFLNLIENRLCNQDKVTLASDITDQEIFNAVKGLNPNKAPGIDGIPIEFYQKFWDIIKSEVINIVKNIITGKLLQHHQKKAIITLLPKGGDPTLLKTWRPISLICSDVKIISKILANRIKPILKNIISPDQYCVNGKTISECNSKLRDSLYYYGKNKSSGAIINLDWEKAFDRVNWSFLIKIMEKMGFPEMIIRWVIVMHTNLQSICLINGNLTSPFKRLSNFNDILFNFPRTIVYCIRKI